MRFFGELIAEGLHLKFTMRRRSAIKAAFRFLRVGLHPLSPMPSWILHEGGIITPLRLRLRQKTPPFPTYLYKY